MSNASKNNQEMIITQLTLYFNQDFCLEFNKENADYMINYYFHKFEDTPFKIIFSFLKVNQKGITIEGRLLSHLLKLKYILKNPKILLKNINSLKRWIVTSYTTYFKISYLTADFKETNDAESSKYQILYRRLSENEEPYKILLINIEAGTKQLYTPAD